MRQKKFFQNDAHKLSKKHRLHLQANFQTTGRDGGVYQRTHLTSLQVSLMKIEPLMSFLYLVFFTFSTASGLSKQQPCFYNADASALQWCCTGCLRFQKRTARFTTQAGPGRRGEGAERARATVQFEQVTEPGEREEEEGNGEQVKCTGRHGNQWWNANVKKGKRRLAK